MKARLRIWKLASPTLKISPLTRERSASATARNMLGGQSAGKASCPDEGPLLGVGLPDVAFSAAPTNDELCALAAQRRFRSILVIKGLDEAPAKVECNIAISELDDGDD